MEIPGDEDKVIVGLAVSWANHDAYYISFVSENTGWLVMVASARSNNNDTKTSSSFPKTTDLPCFLFCAAVFSHLSLLLCKLCACVYALRIDSTDKILRFIKTYYLLL